jgi:hypothetical protein
MSTRAHYHPRGIDIDTGEETLPRWLYREIISLRGHIDPPPAPPVFTCLGNGEPMYVWRNQYGRHFLRHYKDGNPNRHSHRITAMSDEHRRQAEYTRRASDSAGLDTVLEFSTGNGTRLDVAVSGLHDAGFEIQRSHLSRAAAKRRAALSMEAGWPTAWITDRERDPDWADHVPTGRLVVRGWDQLPKPNTVDVIIGQFFRDRDRHRRSGWSYRREPRAVLLDDLAYLMPAGDIIPVAVGTLGRVSLAYAEAAEIIDSCTYPGASQWQPNDATPRHQEAPQRRSSDCRHGSDAPPTANTGPIGPVFTPAPIIPQVFTPTPRRHRPAPPAARSTPARSIGPGRCPYCGWHPTFHAGHAPRCPHPTWPRTA